MLQSVPFSSRGGVWPFQHVSSATVRKTFEVKEASPFQSAFKLYFVQCASCGGVVGVTEYYNISAVLEKLGKHLKVKLT